MRFLRLDLLAYGAFTATRLEFAPERPFQVVLGANAAGKSTALRAIGGLLFGIPERTTDDFLHEMRKLRIGAVIAAADGREVAFVRRKGRKDTLLDADGKSAVPDAALRPFLGAADETLFASMFGLGHEALRRGAEELLQAGGALGESLFEAAGGTRSVRAVLDSLAADADALFKKNASNPRLNAAFARYAEARQTARKAALAGEDFLALEQAIEALGRAIEAQRQELNGLDVERRRLDRVRRNLPRLATRDALRDELSGLATVPDLPAEARDERIALVGRRQQLAAQVARDEAELASLATALRELGAPVALLAAGDDIKRLNEELGAVHKATADLPRRRAELARSHETVSQLLADVRAGLTLDEAAALKLPRPKVSRIRELAERHAELRATRGAADQAIAAARDAVRAAEQALAQATPPRDLSRLVDALQAIEREGNLQREMGESAARRETAWRRAQAEADALHGWHGSLEAVDALPVPLPDTLQRYAAALPAAESEVQRARQRLEERERDLRGIDTELARLHATGDVPTPAQLAAARRRRDEGWQLVRRAYVDRDAPADAAAGAFDPARPLPEAYEAAVAAADGLADALRSDAERVARDQALQERRGAADAGVAEAGRALAAAAAAHAALAQAWEALWTPLAVAPLPPAEMATWLETQRRVRDLVRTAREEDGRHAALAQAVQRGVQLLRDALRAVGEADGDGDDDLGCVLARCQRVRREAEDGGRAHAALQQAVAAAEAALRTDERRRAAAETDLAAWQVEWADLIAPTGHAPGAAPREVEEAQSLLERAFAEHQAASELQRRISGMQEDAAAFAAAVAAVAARVAPDLGGLPSVRALEDLTARFRGAADNQIAREAKAQRQATLRGEVETAQAQLAEVDARLEALIRRAGCAGVEELDAVEARAARKRELTARLAELDAHLVEDGSGLTLGELLDEAREQDGDRVAARLAELDERIAALNGDRDAQLQAQGERRRAREEMLRDTDAAAQATQVAEAELAAIRVDAEAYVRLRLAETMLRQFVERYRERHQDPLLGRASQLFPLLTLDAFRAVRTEFDEDDRPVLVGVGRADVALPVEAMSDGTRDQLYLALRLAAVEQYIAGAEPLPFVADDLLVHFDDERARAALRVLADFSRRTQVLFFTHHPHLVELARREVPPELLQVQSLTAPSE